LKKNIYKPSRVHEVPETAIQTTTLHILLVITLFLFAVILRLLLRHAFKLWSLTIGRIIIVLLGSFCDLNRHTEAYSHRQCHIFLNLTKILSELDHAWIANGRNTEYSLQYRKYGFKVRTYCYTQWNESNKKIGWTCGYVGEMQLFN